MIIWHLLRFLIFSLYIMLSLRCGVDCLTIVGFYSIQYSTDMEPLWGSASKESPIQFTLIDSGLGFQKKNP